MWKGAKEKAAFFDMLQPQKAKLKDRKQMKNMKKKVWIDLDNSPHVLFFAPIINKLEKSGLKVIITARDCFQVCGLADLYGIRYSRIGKHYGKHIAMKAAGTIFRALQLYKSLRKIKPDFAMSHGSRSQLIASKMLCVPAMTIADYEHAKGLPFISPDVLMVPEIISKDINWHSKKIKMYPGIKEDVYLSGFMPDKNVLEELGLSKNDIIVTIRPPATEAHYHNPESEILFNEVVNFLGSKEMVKMVILPRNEIKQGELIRSKWKNLYNERKIIIPDKVVDGPNLIWHSDFVISGGGTMNREAAALGIPVYSIFRGKIGAVDRYLATEGRLRLLKSADDVRAKIKVERKRKSHNMGSSNEKAIDTIVRGVVSVLEAVS